MLDRRLVLVGLPVGALAIYLAQGLISPSEVEFTRAAPPAPAALEMRTAVTTTFLELPVDVSRVAARLDEAVARRLAAPPEPVVDNSCSRRQNAPECTTARTEARLDKTGPVTATVDGTSIHLTVPVSLAEPSTTNEAATGAGVPASLSFSFVVRYADATGFEILRRDDVPLSAAGLSSAQLRALRQWETRLRPAATIAHDELRRALGSLPVAKATAEAWTALSEPIELGKGSGTWLKAVPELVGTGRLVAHQGQPRFRVPIAARLSIEEGARGATPPKRPAIHGQILTNTGAGIRLAMPLQLAGMQQAYETILVKGGPIEMKPDRFGPPVKAVVRKVRAYPSARQLAFELDIAATRFEGQTFVGQAHLVARPQLDAAARTVTLADIALTPPPARDAKSTKAQQNIPRLSAEPLAARLNDLGGFDIGRDLTEILPRINGQLHQQVGANLTLSAHLERAEPVSVETSQSGAYLIGELSGALTFTYANAGTIAAVAPQRTPEQPAASSMQSTVSAAVVTAGAAAGGVLAARAGQAISSPQPAPAPAAGLAPKPSVLPTAAPTTAPPRPLDPAMTPTPSLTAAEPAPAARQQAKSAVRTKVLPARPKSSPSKTAAKSNWVPF